MISLTAFIVICCQTWQNYVFTYLPRDH